MHENLRKQSCMVIYEKNRLGNVGLREVHCEITRIVDFCYRERSMRRGTLRRDRRRRSARVRQHAESTGQ